MTSGSRPTFGAMCMQLQAKGPAAITSARATPYIVTAELERSGRRVMGELGMPAWTS
jgi:hypothetical protein